MAKNQAQRRLSREIRERAQSLANQQKFEGQTKEHNKFLDEGKITMSENHPNNPLQGLTLEHVLVKLEEHYGWPGLSDKVKINCFRKDPSIKSSLKFLRKTPWARTEVEELYLDTFTERSPWHKSIKRITQ